MFSYKMKGGRWIPNADISPIHPTVIVKESDKNSGKTYAVFAVRLTKICGEEEEVSETYHRYSDFHDLHMLIEKMTELLANICNADTDSALGKGGVRWLLFLL